MSCAMKLWLLLTVISYTSPIESYSTVVIVSTRKSPILSVWTAPSLKSSMTNKVSPATNPSDNVFHNTSSSLKVAKGWLAVAFISSQI